MTTQITSPKPGPRTAPFRVMVVDDSLIMRGMISRMIGEDTSVAEVVATVGNGQLAIDRAQKRDIDVIILDIEMPIMDGITALPKLLAIDPKLVIIMASTLTTRNADISLRALSAGAKDYVPKPSSVTPGAGALDFKRELLEKIRVLGQRYRRSPRDSTVETAAGPAAKPAAFALRTVTPGRPQALAIGSSTGGPSALMQMLKALPGPLRVPVFITQHMPPTFTGLLAENLARDTPHPCAEARDGMPVVPGRMFLAPGDYHMTFERNGTQVLVRTNQNEKENFCRPAVDPMLRSLAEVYGRNLLVVMLTGMGQDGLKGSEVVIKAGGNVVAQDEATSVVWGMPGAVARAGLCSAVLPLSQLAGHISMLVGR